jgi:putative copper resistance protein D
MNAVYVQGIGNFVDDISGGLILVALAVVVGAVLWAFFMLRVGRRDAADPALARRCAELLRAGAVALGVIQLLKLATKAVVLTSALGALPVTNYAGTVQVQAGLVRACIAVTIAVVAHGLVAAPADVRLWRQVVLLAVPLVLAGAWLVHAVGRLEHRGVLMALTVVHQLAAAVWVGGVLQLLALHAMRRRLGAAAAFWPVAIARFSTLGIASVIVLLATGLLLTMTYVGRWEGMLGTSYGSLVSAKLVLLALALGFAALNFRAGRAWRRDRKATSVTTRVPRYVESETFVLVTILFVAASVSSLPPAADIPQLTATGSEVLAMFWPRVPTLESPTHAALIAGEAGRRAVVDRVPSAAAAQWSDYNHNVAGVFLLVMGAFAALSYLPRFGFARFWPAGFMLLGLFLFVRADAESWPLGPIGFWEATLGNAEVLQHRLATLLAFCLGALETRARARGSAQGRLRYMFPLLCALGGLLLVTHAHLLFEIKTDFLIQSTHLVMGLSAVVMAVGRWLELRLGDQGEALPARLAGIVSVMAMLAIGYVLFVYEEPVV